jgi:hypothetical protein
MDSAVQSTDTRMTAARVAGRIGAATAAFALLHSALASRAAKSAAAKLPGRPGPGAYRAFFNAQAVLTTAGLAIYVRKLPDRELYSIQGPGWLLLRLGQLAGLLLFVDAVRQVGVLQLTGIASLARVGADASTAVPGPEAQGPSLDEHGALNVCGAFLRSRHPLNFAPVPILWLNPRMTRNLAVFSGVATAYFWTGSWHEERRLLAAYGDAYRFYLKGPVPFFFGARTLIGRTRGVNPRRT